MDKPRREQLSQNFLCKRQLVDQLVRSFSLTSIDLVLEIGPGRGIITQALLAAAGRVIAVELDPDLYRFLRRNFSDPRLILIHGEFLAVPLPAEPYKVFANIPYNITNDIIRRLLQAECAPADCALVVQSEAADKFVPQVNRNTLAAMLCYPWWDVRVTRRLRRSDFSPRPGVDSVLLRMTRRDAPLIPAGQRAAYQDFVAYQFGRNRNARLRAPEQWLASAQVYLRAPTAAGHPTSTARFAAWKRSKRGFRKSTARERIRVGGGSSATAVGSVSRQPNASRSDPY